VWECSRSVYITCVRVRAVHMRLRGEGKQKETGGGGAAVRQFRRVLCGRHVGHIAGERGFLMTTRSIGSMVPPPSSVRPRKYASTSWRHRRRHFRRNWPHHQPRAVTKQPPWMLLLLPMPPTTKPSKTMNKKCLT